LYDPTTGLPTTTQTLALDGITVIGSVATVSDLWGRNTAYQENGTTISTNVFDNAGRLSSVTDPKHTVTYTYDGTDALGQDEHRGLITGMTVSGVGSFTAAYDGTGNMVTQTMPGGITQAATYDLTGSPTSLTYTGTDSDGEPVPLIGWTQDTDLFGRVVHETAPMDAQGLDSMAAYTRTYAYDRAGRLITVNDRSAAPGDGLVEDDAEGTVTPCVTRTYTFDTRGNRLTRSSATSAADGVCTTTGATTDAWTYDGADRVQTGANGVGSYVYDALGRQTTVPAMDSPVGMAAGNLAIGYYDNDLVRSLSQNGTTTTFSLDPMGRRDTATTVSSAGTSTLVRHYADATDNPAWAAATGTDGIAHDTWYGSSIGGDLGLTITDDVVSLEIADMHSDTATALTLDDGAVSAVGAFSDYDEYGRPLAGTAAADTGAVTYGWLGGQERATDDTTGLILMGVRLYNPSTGLFSSPDPVAGGNTTAYAYPQDPINKYDLDGKMWGWLKKARSIAKVVAKVADVAAFIPGPIGMIAAGVATAGYLAGGDYKAAAFAAAGLVPGGKLLATSAKIASKAGKAVKAAKVIRKASRPVSKIVRRGCNSFEPDTEVTLADGSAKPIEDVVVGDEVLSSDGTSNGAEPVTDLIRHLDQHTWVDLTIVTTAGSETIAATSEHPFWVVPRLGHTVGTSTGGAIGTWINAVDLNVGDVLTTADGTAALVVDTATRQSTDWAYNLTIARTHTYYVGDQPVLVHNASCPTGPYSRSLHGGTVTRHYKKFTPARTAGPSAGARFVKEVNHSTGRTRSWMETYGHSGQVTQIHMKKPSGPYYMFGPGGQYIGRRR
jgi:RHS repeat-associated protein